MIAAALGAIAILSFAVWGVMTVCELRFLAEEIPDSNFAPPVSILKPLKGGDAALEQNLETLFALDYPEYEIVFSFATEQDPAFGAARAVADRHPEIPAAFVVDGRERSANPKIARLIPALSRARHPYVLISDGDTVVSSRYLRDTMMEFRDPSVGLVANALVGRDGSSLGGRLEALHLNAFNLSGTAMVSRLLARPCVVGKSMALSRAALEWIGGFASVQDYLAEDFLLGDAVSRAGFRVVLSRHLVGVRTGAKTLAAFFDRHVRWARMRRRLAGPGYLAEIFSSPTPWLALWGVFSTGGTRIAAVSLAVAKIGVEMAVLRRLGCRPTILDAARIAAKDLVALAIFWAGLLSSRTDWRGRSVRLGPRTLLVSG